MYKKVMSAALLGINGYMVHVEVDISEGFPRFDLVGLPDSAVKESIERVRTSIKNSKLVFPYKRITVNLAPAHIKKKGPSFDLPIAVGILACEDLLEEDFLADTVFIGELSLDGQVRKTRGILPMIFGALEAGYKRCMIPYDNKDEGSVVEGIEIVAVENLAQAVGIINGHLPYEPYKTNILDSTRGETNQYGDDFSEIKGQVSVRRALEVAAAGMHNIIMIGPPGSGKTMMAKRIPSILPELSFSESIDLTKIYSVAGLLKEKQGLINRRPFRSPHHSISSIALTGGGSIPNPGEISLAHHGVLFLDELPEFNRNVIEILRQPIEEGQVTISRVNATLTYPSKFMLIASMNPCPCGYYPDIEKCSCTPYQIKRYLSKISGPLLDRIDIHVEADTINYADLHAQTISETSDTIKTRIQEIHQIQKERYKDTTNRFNAHLSPHAIKQFCHVDKSAGKLLKDAFKHLELSARAYYKVLKVARTIADMDYSDRILESHVAEAINYRTLDRKYWNR